MFLRRGTEVMRGEGLDTSSGDWNGRGRGCVAQGSLDGPKRKVFQESIQLLFGRGQIDIVAKTRNWRAAWHPWLPWIDLPRMAIKHEGALLGAIDSAEQVVRNEIGI